MADFDRKRITFEGFMMTLSEAGEKDSEGVFTLAASKSVDRLREQFAGDLSLGFVELVEGFQELGASRVEIVSKSLAEVRFTGHFPQVEPVLDGTLHNPLAILEAKDHLQSGTGLILLEHTLDQVTWTRRDQETLELWEFSNDLGCFERVESKKTKAKGEANGRTWTLRLKSQNQLALFERETLRQWGDSHLSKEYACRLAFSGLSLSFNGAPLQRPLPGRLAPEDHWRMSSSGIPGYNWIPLALQYRASTDLTRGFLSEPFTGVIADSVLVNGEPTLGFGSGSFPDFVSLISDTQDKNYVTVPFQVRRFFGSRKLQLPGFRLMKQKLIHPRMDGGLTRVHCKGYSLICSEILMLSTALVGPSTLVFVRHGVVLGAIHEELGVRGSVCLVDAGELSTDLSRRNIRKDPVYRELLDGVRQRLMIFAKETWQHLNPANSFRDALGEEIGT